MITYLIEMTFDYKNISILPYSFYLLIEIILSTYTQLAIFQVIMALANIKWDIMSISLLRVSYNVLSKIHVPYVLIS